MASNQPQRKTPFFGTEPERRKRHQTDESQSQASLSSYFANTPPPGTPAPPRFDPTPQTQDQEEAPQGYLSAFAQDKDYSESYTPRLDYLNPSIVPEDSHNKMDMNYISWAIRHAITLSITPLQTAQETLLKEQRDLAALVNATARQVRDLVYNDSMTRKSLNDLSKNVTQSLHPLLTKAEEAQGKIAEQIKEVQGQTLLILNKPTPPPPPPATPIIHPRARAPAPVPVPAPGPPRARPAVQQQQQPQQQSLQQPQRSFANVARASNPNQDTFQLVQRRRSARKADPLFKPDFSKANREIIIECNAPSPQAPNNQTPSEIRAKINAGIPDAKCHFIAARKTLNHNIILETKLDTSAKTVLAYKHEIKDVLTGMRIFVIDIRANSKWSKFLLHGIPTTIGDGLDAGQLVASEIRNNYGEKFELAQIPRWITKPEKRIGKEHSTMIIALPGPFTMETLGLRTLNLFDRRCSLEIYYNIREDTQCRNCLEFGHRQEQCTHETGRCGHCAEDHTTDDHPCKTCPGGARCTHSPIRCYNCKGFHKAIDRACPERAKATLRASLRFNESRPQKIASALINVAPIVVAPVVATPIVAPAPAPASTIQVPATPAPVTAPAENDLVMGNN